MSVEPSYNVDATYPLPDVAQAVVAPVEAEVHDTMAKETTPAADTLAIDPPVEAPVDPLAEVPAHLLAELAEVRKVKKRTPKPTRTEANLWWAEAQKAGWTMEQVILTMVLRGWSRFEASWVQHVPPQAVVQGPQAVFKPEVVQPASPIAIARFKAEWARQKAQMLADSARRREEQMARRR